MCRHIRERGRKELEYNVQFVMYIIVSVGAVNLMKAKGSGSLEHYKKHTESKVPI